MSKRKGQSGQMAIFVALIFQVLFVFFAMAINIALVVHDKINLQNAVDFAAYYGAQKQAEWLNVMAHQNYQIRQSFKLMAWRYRVLGTMGIDGAPGKSSTVLPDDIGTGDYQLFSRLPVACLGYGNWEDVASNESLCRRPYPPDQVNSILQKIPQPMPIFPLFPGNIAFDSLVRSVNEKIEKTCANYGGYSFMFVNLIKLAYRLDQANLKQVILTEAANLARPPEAMVDLDGNSVFEGIDKTLKKNLTFENRTTLVEPISVLNSIQGVRPEAWMNEIIVNLNLLYADLFDGGDGCSAVARRSDETPDSGAGIVNRFFPDVNVQALFGEPSVDSIERMSVGFEKNPWFKLYMGVRARTQPRQIFFPFGDPVQFEAVAYATPFGGRMGPWYKERWPQGAPSSDGRKIDKLLPPIREDDAGTLANTSEAERILPNYSRYPGDDLGMQSAMANSAIDGLANFRNTLANYSESVQRDAGEFRDPLVWNGSPGFPMRLFEIAAIAPDLFDITYYSIEPNYGQTYLRTMNQNRNAYGFPDGVFPRPDLGARLDDDTLSEFSVQDQIAQVGGIANPPRGPVGAQAIQRNEAFYFIRDRAHLLTSWVHSDVVADYEQFPQGRFGRCETYDDEYKHQIPGACLFRGGRTGYSVKIISGDHLRSDQLQYGGANQRGSISNPPPEQW